MRHEKILVLLIQHVIWQNLIMIIQRVKVIMTSLIKNKDGVVVSHRKLRDGFQINTSPKFHLIQLIKLLQEYRKLQIKYLK